MRPLQQLPVWVVIRLCTDEDRMVDYWNSVDGEIELNMDVIDDPNGEALEVHKYVIAMLSLVISVSALTPAPPASLPSDSLTSYVSLLCLN